MAKNGGMAALLLGILCALLSACGCGAHTAVFEPVEMDMPLQNPMIGFAPNADHYEAGHEGMLVYVDVTWRELEPKEGVYAFEEIERGNLLNTWRAEGKRVVFRFVCDKPGGRRHMDIPDWLYELTGGDGSWYDTSYGKGFSPNYENETFIERHALAIEALGRRYGNNDFFFYVELGSLGHWGEWHTKYEDGIERMPLEDVREKYIRPYIKAFPNAVLLMRRPFEAAETYGFGVYNDMTGNAEETEVWLDWLENGGDYNETEEQDALVPMANAWKTAAVGGEFTPDLSMESLLTDDLETTVDLIERSHMSFIGPNCPKEELFETAGAQRILSILGYRLRIERAELTFEPVTQTLGVALSWVNDGIAPMYKDWDVYLYLFDQNGDTAAQAEVEIDLRSIVNGTKTLSHTNLTAYGLPKGVYGLGIAILDPLTSLPAVAFAMENSRSDRIYILGEWEKPPGLFERGG